MKKVLKEIKIIIGIIFIFFSYLIVQPIIIHTNIFQIENLIIPFLWSILLIYLVKNGYLYLAINGYFIFLLMLLAEKMNFGGTGVNEVLTYSVLCLSFIYLFILIYQELYLFHRFKIATILSYIVTIFLYIIPISFIIYNLNYDTSVNKDILYAVFQTNILEAFEQVSDTISIQWIFLFIFFAFILGIFLIKQEKKKTLKIEKSLLIFLILVFFSITFVHISELKLASFILKNYDSYHKELNTFVNLEKKDINFTASKKGKSETYIVIIGESLNKKHMGIYNYFRNTTPNLLKIKKDNNLIIFKNAYSNYVHTAPSLTLALTQANQINKKTFYNSISIMDILNKTNFETYWVTNQNIGTDAVSLIAKSAKHLININNLDDISFGKSYDEKVIPEVNNILNTKIDKNKVIFVHLMGSHADYCSRYPHEKFNIFNSSFKRIEIGKKSSLPTVSNIKSFDDFKALIKIATGTTLKRTNCYDNSVLYNDYVVNDILQLLKKQKGCTGLIYMSDHGEDIIHQLAHNATKFTFEMTQIPMIAWLSSKYKQKYPKKYKNIKKHTRELFPNDFFYDTLIGMFDINTTKYNKQFDITSSLYYLDEKNAYTLHGKIQYNNQRNYSWIQYKNSKYIKDINQSYKIIPSNINTIGALKDILYDEFNSFGINISWLNSKNIFNINLDTLFSSVKYNKIQNIWINLKGLDINNYKKILKRLEYLENKFNIKNKIILNIHTTNRIATIFKKNNWNISYDLLSFQKNDIKKLKEENFKNYKGISFNEEVYPLIKKYLQPLIKEDVQFYIKSKIKLYNNDFTNILLNKNYYLDKHIGLILINYNSYSIK